MNTKRSRCICLSFVFFVRFVVEKKVHRKATSGGGMNAGTKIRVALVGMNFGAYWVPLYRDHPDVEFVGICERDPDLLERAVEQHGVARQHRDIEEVVASEDYDAVHLFTGIPEHAAQSVAVLDSGKHCACAIPMAVTREEIHAIVAAQRRSGKQYFLAETEVFSPAFCLAQRLQDKGTFGDIQLLRAVHYQNMENWPGYWRGLPPMYYSSHGIGPALQLLGKDVTHAIGLGSGHLAPELQAVYGNPYPIESALFELQESDVICEATVCLFKMAREWLVDRFYIYGDRASFESPQRNGGKPLLFEAEPGELPAEQRGRRVAARELDVPHVSAFLPPEYRAFAHSFPFDRGVLCVHEFVRSVLEGRPPAVDVQRAANWTAAGLAAHESALQGGARVAVTAE